MTRFGEKPASMHTRRRHTFHHQTIAVHINNQVGIDAEGCPVALLWLVSEAF